MNTIKELCLVSSHSARANSTLIEMRPYFATFLQLSMIEQEYELNGFAWCDEAHRQFLNESLTVINAYLAVQVGLTCHIQADDDLHAQMLRAKDVLERDLRRTRVTGLPR